MGLSAHSVSHSLRSSATPCSDGLQIVSEVNVDIPCYVTDSELRIHAIVLYGPLVFWFIAP